MKIHFNPIIYDSFYMMKNINYQFNNPIDTKPVLRFENNIKRSWNSPRVSRNSVCKFILI